VGTPRRTLDPDAIVPWLAAALNRPRPQGVIAGVAEDDCGVFRIGKTLAVVSIDFVNATPIVEQLGMGAEREIGRLVVAATLSDLLGSGAAPIALMVGVTVPHGYPESRFKELMLGARSEARRWKTPIIAGDTKLGHGRAVLTCGVGTARSPRELFLANRAKADDEIYVSGHLGTCAAATYVASIKTRRPYPRWVKTAITVPRLPIELSSRLGRLRIANAGMDISDGLAADLRSLCAASNVGAEIEADAIPVRPEVSAVANAAKVQPWAFSMASGGDFQFMVTIPRRYRDSAESLGLVRIGRITAQRRMALTYRAGSMRVDLPRVGHKDRRRQTFAAEVRKLISEVGRV
jgi:thiamine-monophosphate kinase